jgi:hypothetical protein
MPDTQVLLAYKHWAPNLASAQEQFVPHLNTAGVEHPGWTPSNAMHAKLAKAAQLGVSNVSLYGYGHMFTGGLGIKDNPAHAAVKRFVAQGYDISYRPVAFSTRRDLSHIASGRLEQLAKVDKARRGRVDYKAAVRAHRFDTGYAVGGLVYGFESRTWK